MDTLSSLPLLKQGADVMNQQNLQQAHRLADTAGKSKQKDALRQVAKEFESLFMNLMLKEMRNTVPKFDPLHSYAEETYQEMLDQEMTKQMVQHRSIGLADMVYRQLSQLEQGSSR